jgi:hypothetical protein
MRSFVIMFMLGLVASLGGCGSNSEEGTRVEVDKDQQAVMLKKTEEYMKKFGSPQKARRTLSSQAKEK